MSIKANKKGVRILLKLLLNFVISLALYNTIIFLGEKVHVAIYYVGSTLYVLAIAVLFCVYYVKNGFSVTSVSSDSTSDSNDSGSESMRHEDAKSFCIG